jgi:hypothetical protein
MGFFTLETFRGNFLVAFCGAALIVFLIKITPLVLPAKYYFSFSSLVGSGSEPFIVDPPGVTGQKLCGLLEKYDIPRERFTYINCKLNYAEETKSGVAGTAFTPEERDKIYTVILQGDPQLRSDVQAAMQAQPPTLPSEEDVNAIIAESGTVSRAFDKLQERYKSALDEYVQAAAGDKLKTWFAAEVAASNAQSESEPDEASGEEAGGQLPDDAAAKVLTAYRNAASRLDGTQLASALAPIKKSDVDDVIKRSYGWYGIDDSILGHYKSSLSDEYVHNVLMDEFKKAGLDVKTPEEQRRLIFAEINSFSLVDYILSILIRLAPVVIVGVGLGYALGRSELLSISIAGALAAFLLSWPLMLMWDRLVQSTWHDKKAIFLMFYTAYIVAFFVTARASALLGAKLRQKLGPPEPAPASAPKVPIKWAEITGNIVVGLLMNAAVFIGNVIIPLQALSSN